MEQGRPGQEQGALLGQQGRLEGGHGAGGVAEGDHHAQGAQAVQGAHEGLLAHGVVDRVHALAAGDLPHPGNEVLAGVDDGVVAAVGTGDLRLGIGAHGADHRGPQAPGPLAGDQADATGGRVDQHRVTGFHPVDAPQQVVGRHAAQHHRGGGALLDVVRQLHQARGRHDAGLGIGPGRRRGIGHPVAFLEGRHPFPHVLHHARGLHAQAARQGRQRVESGAEVDVDEVQAHGGLAQAHLAGSGFTHLDGFPAHDLGAAGLVDSDCMGHGVLLGQGGKRHKVQDTKD